jgi:hypothetical protein
LDGSINISHESGRVGLQEFLLLLESRKLTKLQVILRIVLNMTVGTKTSNKYEKGDTYEHQDIILGQHVIPCPEANPILQIVYNPTK